MRKARGMNWSSLPSSLRDTGVVLDPVYMGKALYNFFREVVLNPDHCQYRNQTIFIAQRRIPRYV